MLWLRNFLIYLIFIYMKQNKNVFRINEIQLKAMIAESLNNILYEYSDTFNQSFNRAKAFRQKYGGYGFNLRRDGQWRYGEIEYDPNAQVMSCMGVSIKVTPNMSISEAEEDLFEALINAGFESDF